MQPSIPLMPVECTTKVSDHHGVMIEVSSIPVISVKLRFRVSSFFSSEMEDGTSAMHNNSQKSSWGDDH
jgi:hypothetical protein